MAAATYTFTNACAVSDDFNALSINDDATSTCWNIIAIDPNYPTWASMTGIMAFDTPNSTLNANFTGHGSAQTIFGKTAKVDTSFSGTIHVESFDPAGLDAGTFMLLTDALDDSNFFVQAGVITQAEGVLCFALIGAGDEGCQYTAPCAENSDYYVRFVIESTTPQIPAFRSGSAAEYTPMEPVEEGCVPPVIDFGSIDVYYALGYMSSAAGGDLINVDSVQVDGVTVTGQY